jgi:hypothetical protein
MYDGTSRAVAFVVVTTMAGAELSVVVLVSPLALVFSFAVAFGSDRPQAAPSATTSMRHRSAPV